MKDFKSTNIMNLGSVMPQETSNTQPLLDEKKEELPIVEKKKSIGFLSKKKTSENKREDLEEKVHKFDPLKMPCNWTEAKTHAAARSTGPEVPLPDGHVQPTCDCCGFEVQRQPVNWKKDGTDTLNYLGPGFSMFYSFIKFAIAILVTEFVIEGIVFTYNTTKGSFCEVPDDAISPEEWKEGKACVDDWILRLSTANIKDQPELMEQSIWFSYVTVLVIMGILIYFRKVQKEIQNNIDANTSTAADYSIVVKNIPRFENFDYETELRNIFSKATEKSRKNEETLEIKKVTLVYNIEKLEKLEHQIKEVVKQKQKYLIEHGYEEKNEECINDQAVKDLDQKIHDLHHQVHEMIHNKTLPFAGIAFISYNTKEQKEHVVAENQMNSWHRFKAYFNGGESNEEDDPKTHLYMKNRHVYVEQAPEANEIDWEFIHDTTTSRIIARIKCNLMQLGLIALCFLVVYLLSYYKSWLIDHAFDLKLAGLPGSEETYVMAWVIAYLIAAFIIAFNKFCLGFLVHQICDREKWSTKTKMNISFAQKLTISLFVNTAVITFAVEILTFNNYYGVGGMMFTEYIIFILNGIVPPFAFIADPWSKLKNYRRKKELAKTRSVLTQIEANCLMEHESYTMGKRYADIMKTMWFTFLYCPALPLATPWSIMGLSIYYFADKYNVMHRRTIKESIGPQLSIEMIEMLEYIMLLHTFGNFWFSLFLFDQISYGSIILFIISFIYIQVPIQEWTEYIFNIHTPDEDAVWDDVILDLDTDYDRENPVLKDEAIAKWQKLRDNKEKLVNKNENLTNKMKSSALLGGIQA